MRKAVRPQTGKIRHQNDCLVKTSNFSSLSARGLERPQRVPSLPPPTHPRPPWPPTAGVSGLWGQPQRKAPETGTPDTQLPRTITRGKPWGETGRGLSWGAPDRLVAKKRSLATDSAGALGFLVTMATQESHQTLATMRCSAGPSGFCPEFQGLQGSISAAGGSGLSQTSCMCSTRQGLTNPPPF